MSVYFVSRHSGAREWAHAAGIAVDEQLMHLDIACIRAGDTVIGSLPVNLAAEVCAREARYLHLSLEVPSDRRGRELTAAEMRRYGARVEEYRVEKIAC